ncbi:MAG TPA: aminotransferase class I/II-fold pyridoxal phosphate-dependent enzyme [Candidatus Limosilactobacillus merdipullorum]|uniref:Aminotransferase n=1 Tax=Candidatus Limosilactobacillus merdipullorum TaxID=2838653 RepID=A0A9D1QNW3_9LACO|nr:aminotransferase class I/II-fold pyridoxal phosphate-dependent enzyme [Candidatus Limosilactobacillus merdipullorum]
MELASSLKGKINPRLLGVSASGVRSFDAMVSSIPGVVKLTIGEPDLNVPEHVKKAANTSITDNDSHYAPQNGTKEFRDAIANYIHRNRGLTYDPETEIVATIGATEAISSTFFSILKAGDKIIIPTPEWSLYFPLAELAGAKPILVDTSADNFIMTPKHLEKVLEEEGPAVKAILLNYPNNPTGREYPEDVLRGLSKVIEEHNLFCVADEIYSDLVYNGTHFSIANVIQDRTVLISGLSKSHAMTGYRLGYLCAPAELAAQIEKMHALMVTAVNDSAQAAGAEALNNGAMDPVESSKIYIERRDYLSQVLNEIGMQPVSPDGAFYLFAKIPESFGDDDLNFATRLAKEGKVGCVPGSYFGNGGGGYVRFSYAASMDTIQEAAKRLKAFVEANK